MQRRKESKINPVYSIIRQTLAPGLGRSLLIRFLLISILPMVFVSWLSVNNTTAAIREDETRLLDAITQAKYQQLSAYFNNEITNLRLHSELANTVNFLTALKHQYRASNKSLKAFSEGYLWAILQDEYASDLSHILTTYNYIDILLIDIDGNILFSIRRDDDLASNLFNGQYKNSHFAEAAKKALISGEPVYSDLEKYPPYTRALSSFLLQAVVDEFGEKMGVLAIHLSNIPIAKILEDHAGLGESGETYLIGKDLLMRSKSRFSKTSTVLEQQIETSATLKWQSSVNNKALTDVKGLGLMSQKSYLNYRDVNVFGIPKSVVFAGVPMLLIAEVDEREIFSTVDILIKEVALTVLITILLVFLISIFSVRFITEPIMQLTRWAKEISLGSLKKVDIKVPNNEIGVLNNTFVELVDSLSQVKDVMAALSVGDLSQSMQPRGINDVLVYSLNQLSRALQSVVDQADIISLGNYEAEVELRSDKDALGTALKLMTENLRLAEWENNRQTWLKTAQSDLANELSGDLDVHSLADNVAAFFAHHFHAHVAEIYIHDPYSEESGLTFVGGYACRRKRDNNLIFAMGEGLVGQVAADKKIILLQDVPKDYLMIESSLGQSNPLNILLAPFVTNDETVAVIELGSFNAFTDDYLELLRLSSESIAIAFDSCFTRRQTDILLIETQRQSDELRRYNEELDKKAKELALASSYKTDFLANMSHEIRTPMNAIIGFVRRVLKSDLSDDQIGYVKKIELSADSLLDIINDILDFSKIEAGKLELDNVEFDLYDVIHKVVSITSFGAHEKSLEFLVDQPATLPHFLVGDSMRLQQILINLSNNAVKFTLQGHILVKIEHLESDDDGITLQFSVKDTGIGIKEEKMAILFESFSQADTTITRDFGGTGLGLAISKRLVNLMGGDLIVTSTEGKGSCFSFTAQFGISTMIEDVVDVQRDIDVSNALVVDDNASARLVLENLLSSYNLNVTSVASGEEALEKIRDADNHYGLILLDWKMPGLDGIATAEKIHQLKSGKDAPILMMVSAFDDKFLREKASKAGIKKFINKPVMASTLLDSMNHYFPIEGRIAPSQKKTQEDWWLEGAFTGKCVLLVEDNIFNQQVATEILQESGIVTTVANHGQECLDLLAEKEFDLILMDVQMPVMDGYTATKIIRQNKKWHNLPVLAMTAHAMREDYEKSIAAGMNDHISKPIDVDVLYERLAKFLHIVPTTENNDENPDEKDVQTIENLPGLNIQEGLKRIRNNQNLYLDLCNMFIKDYSLSTEHMRTFSSQSDFEGLAGLAHKIKGTAGTLGGNDLMNMAADIELLASDHTVVSENAIERFDVCLQQTITSLQTFMDKHALSHAQPASVPANIKPLHVLLSEVEHVLKADGIVEDSVIKTLSSYSLEEKNYALMQAFLSSVDQFDYEVSLELLNQLKQQC